MTTHTGSRKSKARTREETVMPETCPRMTPPGSCLYVEGETRVAVMSDNHAQVTRSPLKLQGESGNIQRVTLMAAVCTHRRFLALVLRAR